MRIDDLDTPRTKPGAADEALIDLRWLGLDWEGPILRQSERSDLYEAAADALLQRGLAYPCVCTRKEIALAASAPHGPAGPPYPRTCDGAYSSRAEAEAAAGRDAALRFRVPADPVVFNDELFGPQSIDLNVDGGDFPILRKGGAASYQLATVIDDAATDVDLVIRGADLLPSTARQRVLQQALGLPLPRTLHLPLVVAADGRRLAKRHGDTRIRMLRQQGWTAERLLGWIASTLNLASPDAAISLSDLLDRYSAASLDTQPVVVEASDFFPGAPGT